MKNLFRLVILFVFMAFLPSANATDVTGTWKGSVDVQGDNVQVTFHLTAAGNTVTGTVERTSAATAEIHDGKVDGDSLSFWINEDYQGQTYKVICKGKVLAEKIELAVGTDDSSWSTEMTAAKSL
jgi:molybdopterin-binding protein